MLRPALYTSIVPPCISTRDLLIANPSPSPPNCCVIELSACSKALKIRPCASGSIPIPLSFTSATTSFSSRRQWMLARPPCGANLMAFFNRFQKTCWRRGTSAAIQ